MTQAPYQQAPYQQPNGYQQGYQPGPQGLAPYQQQPQPGQYQQGAPQQGGYQPAPQPQQQGYQPVAQPGPVQSNQQVPAQPEMQAYDPEGADPLLEDVSVFRGGGVAPFMAWSDPACTGYERGGTILAVGSDWARKFGTQDPAFWEYGPKKGQQIMCRILIVQTNERIPGKADDTGIRTIELKDGTGRFQAAALAVRAASPNDLAFRPGAQIYFTRTGTRQSNKGGQPAITYNARYVPAPADYTTTDQGLMAQNMLEQSQAPSPEAQQMQQAAAYVASTPNGGQPQYQATPNGAPAAVQGQPWQQQGPAPAQAPANGQPAPWMTQGPGQSAPAPAQGAPWQQQGPQQGAPWQGQAPQQPAPQAAPWQAQGQSAPVQGHPFGQSTQQPMQSPYPQGQPQQ